MKIRDRRLVAAAGWISTRLIHTLFQSLRFEYRPLADNCAPSKLRAGERYLYCIWHENLLLPTVEFGCKEIAVLISQHADGKLLGSLIQSMGMGTVEGSTTRGGIEAVRRMTRDDNPWRHLAITPDGPRGPRRVVQNGIVYIASRTGMKIVPIGVGFRNAWRMGSWDRFAIPKPFTSARLMTAEPIAVPDKLMNSDLEPYRHQVQNEMDRLSRIAESWAKTGRLELPVPNTSSVRLAG